VRLAEAPGGSAEEEAEPSAAAAAAEGLGLTVAAAGEGLGLTEATEAPEEEPGCTCARKEGLGDADGVGVGEEEVLAPGLKVFMGEGVPVLLRL
jgi:hypothetical protein